MEEVKKLRTKPEIKDMPTVLLSLHQKWWNKMVSGEKVLELRKSKPKGSPPLRVMVYVTGGVGVVGEFVCLEVLEIKNFEDAEKQSKVSARDIHNYAAGSRCKVYGWKVAAVQQYEKAMTLSELGIQRAPQSWRYIKNKEENVNSKRKE